MNLQEFKAWLEGYSASFVDGVPNAEQWATVAEKLRNVQPLTFAPYGPRPDYYVGDPAPTSAPQPYWMSPIVTC